MTDEIAFILDLFDGQLGYEDVYSRIPIRNLTNLCRARVRLIEKKEKIQAEMISAKQNEPRQGSPR